MEVIMLPAKVGERRKEEGSVVEDECGCAVDEWRMSGADVRRKEKCG
jgi:hypothetical protein